MPEKLTFTYNNDTDLAENLDELQLHHPEIFKQTFVDWTKNTATSNVKPTNSVTYEQYEKDIQATPTQNNGSDISQLTMGVYELPSGEIYVVKPNRDKTRLYAKKLVEAPSDRLTETGQRVSFDFEYERGAIYTIRPEYKMSLERGKELMIRYGRCIICGRRLKVAESVERGIGPICIKYFRGN